MGSRLSRLVPTSSLARNATRKYPTREPPSSFAPSSQVTTDTGLSPTPSSLSTSRSPKPYASTTRHEAIRADAQDPDFDAMLRSIGTAELGRPEARGGIPHAMNPQLRTLAARQKMEERGGVHVDVIRAVLSRRDEGWGEQKIEETYKLPKGTMQKLKAVANPGVDVDFKQVADTRPNEGR